MATGENIVKKLIVGLLAAILMAAGLVGTTTSSAQAACTRYGGCPATSTAISGDNISRVGQVKSYTVSIAVNGSNAAPRGVVRIIVRGVGRRTQGQGYSQTKSARRVTEFSFGRQLPKGKYQVRAIFQSSGSQDNSSSRTIGLKNRGARR